MIPIIGDVLSHTFNEANHISTTHLKYGNDHLQLELAAKGADNDKGKTERSVRSEDQAAVHLAVNAQIKNRRLNIPNVDHPCFKIYKLSAVFISKHIPPPKFLY